MICAWIETSSADTGSSSTMSRGSIASARATPMRWRWPPENSCGKRLTCSGERPDAFEQLAHAPLDVVAARARALQRHPDDLADPLARVQRRVRVLEDHLHLAAQRHERAARGVRDVRAAEAHGAARRLEQAHDRPRQRRLAAARLADEPQRLALDEREGDVVDRVHRADDPVDEHALLDREVQLDVLDLEQRRRAVRRAHAASRETASASAAAPSAPARSRPARSRAGGACARPAASSDRSARATLPARLQRRHLRALRRTRAGSAGAGGSPRDGWRATAAAPGSSAAACAAGGRCA